MAHNRRGWRASGAASREMRQMRQTRQPLRTRQRRRKTIARGRSLYSCTRTVSNWCQIRCPASGVWGRRAARVPFDNARGAPLRSWRSSLIRHVLSKVAGTTLAGAAPAARKGEVAVIRNGDEMGGCFALHRLQRFFCTISYAFFVLRKPTRLAPRLASGRSWIAHGDCRAP